MQDRHYKHWPMGVPKRFPLPETSLCYNLEVAATRYARKTAIFFYGGKLSYAELKAQVDALAGYLQQDCGVRRGDRVLLDMQNSPQFVIAYYAILRADAAVVPVNPMNLTAELAHYVADAGTKLAICGHELLPRVAPLLAGQGLERIICANYADYIDAATDLPLPDFFKLPAPARAPGIVAWGEALAAARAPAEHLAGPDDLAALPYTSGTTGNPKGCMHTHRTLMGTIALAGVWARGSADDVSLAVVPFFHVTGMQMLMNGNIYLGAAIVVMTRWDRELALKLIERHQVTSWINIPTMVIDLFASPNFKSDSLASLRGISGGGAAMPEAVAKRLYELTGLEFCEGYGLTETAAPTHSNHPSRPKRQCLGIPMCNTESRVIDPDTLKELGPGETGEIVSSGPQVFTGYWNNPEATRDAFIEIDGKRFFRTGDLGRYDEDGYFFMVDRLKRMINASGFKVWPAEVELMMFGHPDIQEACVIGAQDAYRGETVKAVVVLKAASKGKVQPEDIIEWCKTHMAAYKYPRVVELADSLPKSATGKVMWRALQEQESARAQAKA
ncbi:MAG: long-chain fatty acid--CoA ligase [Burkholderiales bacterium]